MENGAYMPDEKLDRDIPGCWIYEWLRPLALVLTVLLVLITFAMPLVAVEGESMRETLQSGDRILALRPWLYGEIERGDIVIVREESFDDDPIIKRVIAMGGDTVDIDFTLGAVMVNGEVLEEPYIRELTFLEEGVRFPLTVEENSLFLLGDNRNNSADSRYTAIGTVEQSCIIGKAALLFFPGADAVSGERDLSRIGLLNR